MSKKMPTFLVAVACFFSITSTALCQEQKDLSQEIRRLNQKIEAISRTQDRLVNENAHLKRDNADLRDMVETNKPIGSELETSLNSLADSVDLAAGTIVNSVANPITLSAQFRFRAGYTSNRDFGADSAAGGVRDASDDHGTFVDARINVAFDFALSNNVTAHFETISSGLFNNSEVNSNTGTFDEVNLYQGYLLLDKLFGRDEIGLRVGRQEIVLGNELFFGNNSFYGGENHDATLLWWGQKEWSLTLVWTKFDINATYNPSGHPYPPFQSGGGFDDDEAYAAYFTLNTIENHVLDLYYFYVNANGNGGTTTTLGFGIPSDTFMHVVGLRFAGDLPSVAAGLDYNFEFAYETGEINGTGIDIEGMIVEAEVGLTFNAENKLRVFGRFVFAEGGDANETGFVPLFVDRHEQVNWDDHTQTRARWGLMDIIPLNNVIAGQIGITFMPTEDWILGATVLAAWHDEDVMTTDGNLEDGIGWEIDVFADYRMSAETTISLGLGIFLPNEGAPLEGNAPASPSNHAGKGEDSAAFLFYLQALTTF